MRMSVHIQESVRIRNVCPHLMSTHIQSLSTSDSVRRSSSKFHRTISISGPFPSAHRPRPRHDVEPRHVRKKERRPGGRESPSPALPSYHAEPNAAPPSPPRRRAPTCSKDRTQTWWSRITKPGPPLLACRTQRSIHRSLVPDTTSRPDTFGRKNADLMVASHQARPSPPTMQNSTQRPLHARASPALAQPTAHAHPP